MQVQQLKDQVQERQHAHEEDVQLHKQTLAAQHEAATGELRKQHVAERGRWESEAQQLKAELAAQESRAGAESAMAAQRGVGGSDQDGHSSADASVVEDLVAEIERLRQQKADAETHADELAASLAAERRRVEQVHASPRAR